MPLISPQRPTKLPEQAILVGCSAHVNLVRQPGSTAQCDRPQEWRRCARPVCPAKLSQLGSRLVRRYTLLTLSTHQRGRTVHSQVLLAESTVLG